MKKDRNKRITSFDKATFAELAGHPADVCVTIYQTDRQALGSALQKVRETLSKNLGDRVNTILGPAEAWLHDDAFWQDPPAGLALFLAPDYHARCSLPFDPGNECHIRNSFILTPLAPLLNEDEEYFVLTLSKHAAKLYHATAHELQPLDIPEMPAGIDDVAAVEEKGNSGAGTENKQNIALYFKEVDRTLREQGLGSEHIPLLLAGVEYLLPIYRQANTYPHLLDAALTGNYDHMPLPELFQQARDKMEAIYDEQWKQAINKDLDHGTAPVTSFAQDVIKAAFDGKVRELFVAKDTHVWGRYDQSTDEEPRIHDQEEPGDDCLTNEIVIETILHGGKVHVVNREQMPVDSELTAVLRYS